MCQTNCRGSNSNTYSPLAYVTISLGGAIHLLGVLVLVGNFLRFPFICPSEHFLGSECPFCGLTGAVEELITTPTALLHPTYWDEALVLGNFLLLGVTFILWLSFRKAFNPLLYAMILASAGLSIMARGLIIYS
jgi:hypothetical protein